MPPEALYPFIVYLSSIRYMSMCLERGVGGLTGGGGVENLPRRVGGYLRANAGMVVSRSDVGKARKRRMNKTDAKLIPCRRKTEEWGGRGKGRRLRCQNVARSALEFPFMLRVGTCFAQGNGRRERMDSRAGLS
jgi:hypothetical protein